jgi:hypothetical protein
MRKYTEGPWQIMPEEVDRDYIRIRGTRLGQRYKIANVLTPTHPGVSSKEAEETRANAALIVTSPRLLACIKDIRIIISDGAQLGFNCKEGDWADRLFKSQGVSYKIVADAEHYPERN